jgi:hypothetical protein
MNPLTQSKNTTILIALMLICFALSPTAQAVCQEGCDVSNFNTFLGDEALSSNTTGISNTATGASALQSNTTGFNNTANGANALFFNTTGISNTANGTDALASNTTGFFNTATGQIALFSNTTGISNTATGVSALQSNTTGTSYTANGAFALQNNTTGGSNTATGFQALNQNTTGFFNAATGGFALFSNTTGAFNTATGTTALNLNTTGINNTVSGYQALSSNTTGSNNIALGYQAGINLTTGNNNIDIGNAGVAGESRRIRIGTAGTHRGTFIAGIRGVTTQNANAIPVLIDSAGQLGTMSSSRRFKKEIKRMDQTSEAILGLKPVTFHYKSDSKGTPQFGLIAEEVAQVNPDLVVRDENGEIYTVRYEAVNAMLLNEFLKEHRKNEEQQAMIARLEKQIEALTAGLQKVSAQVELSKSAPQTVLNNQ